jgi:recombination protein RecA
MSLSDILKSINKKYGEGTIANGSGVQIEAVPTGCYSLDNILGCGGLPKGRLIEVYGQQASGKSTLGLFLIAQIQKKGGKALLIDSEFAYDKNYAAKIGVDTDKLLLVQPNTGEEGAEIWIETLKSGELDIIVIDSVAALAPEKEITGEITDLQIAPQARMMGKALRMTVAAIAKTKTIVILVNQLRDKIGMFVGVSQTTPGGNALKFYASVRLEVKSIKRIKEGESAIGNRLKITATKNKVGLPFRSTEIDLYFEKGIDVAGDLLDNAVEKKVVSKTNNTYTYEDKILGKSYGQAKSYLESPENESIFASIWGKMTANN